MSYDSYGKEKKRRLERFELKIPAKIEVMTSDKDKETLDLFTSDICAGGVFFHTDQPLPEGTDVKIDLVLPLEQIKKLSEKSSHAYINITGTVIRSASSGMAVCFNKNYKIQPWNRKESPEH